MARSHEHRFLSVLVYPALILLFVALIGSMLTGCGSKNPLAGDWIPERRPSGSVRGILPYSGNLTFYYIEKNPGYVDYPVFASMGMNNPETLEFQKVSGFHTDRQGVPDYYVLIRNIQGKHYDPPFKYMYVSKTGEIGIDRDWCFVSRKFRDFFLAKAIKPGVFRDRLKPDANGVPRTVREAIHPSIPVARLVGAASDKPRLALSDSMNPQVFGFPHNVEYCEATWKYGRKPVNFNEGMTRLFLPHDWPLSGNTLYQDGKFVTKMDTAVFPLPEIDEDLEYQLQFRWFYRNGSFRGPSSKVYTFTLPDR